MKSSTQQPSLARGAEIEPRREVAGAATDPALRGKRIRLAITLAFALAIWFLPPPGDLSVQAWRLFAIFGSTILSVMIGAIPILTAAVLGLAAAVLTGIMPPSVAYTSFANP